MNQREFVEEAITKIINDNKLDDDVKYLNCAIVLLMFSSGLQFKEVKKLKLKDFEESCKYIENYGSIDSFIKRDPIKEKIIPIWDLSDEKKGKIRIVCSSPEATYFIFQYLHKRRKNLNSKDSLFVGKNGKELHEDYPSKDILTYYFRTEILKDSNEDVSKFKPSKLSKYLIDLLGHESFNMGKLFEGTTAKKPKDTYKKIKNDESNILDYYKKVLPYIKIDINAILKDNTSKDIVTKVGAVTKEDITVNKISTSEECENQYLQELHRQDKSLRDEITMLINDFNNIDDLVVKTKLKTIIEKKEKRLLELKREAEEWHLKMQH